MLYALDPFIYDPVIKESREIEMTDQSRYWFAQGHLMRYFADPFTSAANVGFQGVQGILNWRLGLYGVGTPLAVVFGIELLIASAVFGTLGYLIDPLDRYEGGLAEYLSPAGQKYAKEVWESPMRLVKEFPLATATHDPQFDIGMRWGQL